VEENDERRKQNVGDLNYNMNFSQAGADAVVKELVSRYKSRLYPA
jgi:hypothetical protein